MSYMYQKNLDLVYSSCAEVRRQNGRITHQKMHTLKSMSARKVNTNEPAVRSFNKFLSAVFCFVFRPRLANTPEQAKTRIISENTSSFKF